LKKYLQCGRLQNRADGVHYFVVGDYRSIANRVIPFVERFPFQSESKQRNFSLFKKISLLMAQGKHLEPDGFNEIVMIRERLNEGRGRKRKYEEKDVCIATKVSSETIRQTSISVDDDIVRTA
jgi:hypothetical protein